MAISKRRGGRLLNVKAVPKGHIDQRLRSRLRNAREARDVIQRLKPPITLQLDGTFRARGVYVISAIMSNICAILLARSRPYCSRK